MDWKYGKPASLRAVSDVQPLLSRIRERTGVGIVVLSGEEEAACSFSGMLSAFAQRPDTGVMVDMGGGSTEIGFFAGGKPEWMHSCRFGAVSLQKSFCGARGLTEEQEAGLKNAVRTCVPPQMLARSVDRAYMVGGTAKACAKLGRAFFSGDGAEMTVKEFKELKKLLCAPDDRQYEMMKELCPERYVLMAAGSAAFEELFDAWGVRKVVFCDGGVREGFLERVCGKELRKETKKK